MQLNLPTEDQQKRLAQGGTPSLPFQDPPPHLNAHSKPMTLYFQWLELLFPKMPRSMCLVGTGLNTSPWVPTQDSLVLVLPSETPLWLVPFLGQDETQLLVGGEGGKGAIDALAGLCSVPVVLSTQVDPVAAGRAFIVVPPRRTLP